MSMKSFLFPVGFLQWPLPEQYISGTGAAVTQARAGKSNDPLVPGTGSDRSGQKDLRPRTVGMG